MVSNVWRNLLAKFVLHSVKKTLNSFCAFKFHFLKRCIFSELKIVRNLNSAVLWQSVVSMFILETKSLCLAPGHHDQAFALVLRYFLGFPYNDTTKDLLSFESRDTEEPQSQCLKLLLCLKLLQCVDTFYKSISQAKVKNWRELHIYLDEVLIIWTIDTSCPKLRDQIYLDNVVSLCYLNCCYWKMATQQILIGRDTLCHKTYHTAKKSLTWIKRGLILIFCLVFAMLLQ